MADYVNDVVQQVLRYSVCLGPDSDTLVVHIVTWYL